MTTLNRFVDEVALVCAKHSAHELVAPLEAVAAAVFPQLVRVEGDRITHRSHPIRVLDHLLLCLRDHADTPPPVTLALGLAALCHDASTARKKSSTLVARSEGAARQLEEESRRAMRLVHEAEGVVELVRAVVVANDALRSAGHPAISTESLEIAARVVAVHDTPSLRSVLPLTPGTAAGDALRLFVLADAITMLEFDAGLASPVPHGPLVETWARGEPIDASSAEAQVRSSVKSVKTRLQAAFELPAQTDLAGCFLHSATLAALAVTYSNSWASELGITLDA
jgi:hypothetical protein